MKQVHEYYPVEEILAHRGGWEGNRNSLEAFRKIDVWMLGKAFERLLERGPLEKLMDDKFSSLLKSYREMVTAMISSKSERCSMEDVKALLLAMK